MVFLLLCLFSESSGLVAHPQNVCQSTSLPASCVLLSVSLSGCKGECPELQEIKTHFIPTVTFYHHVNYWQTGLGGACANSLISTWKTNSAHSLENKQINEFKKNISELWLDRSGFLTNNVHSHFGQQAENTIKNWRFIIILPVDG